MKIVLIISMIGPGGAERVVATMANELVRAYDVSILTFNSGPKEIFYKFDTRVKVRCLNLLGATSGVVDALRENLRRIRVLRKAIRDLEPDVLVSFLPETNVLAILSRTRRITPIIVTEHTDPLGTKPRNVWNILRWLTYRNAAAIVVLNGFSREYYKKRFRVPVVQIPNPVLLVNEEKTGEKNSLPRPYIVAVGRLVPKKRIADIVCAFSQLQGGYPNWNLVVVGDGPLRTSLEKTAGKYGIRERVIFTGLLPSMSRVLRDAEIFVSASVTEAFPMAICEAMACGVPVVVRDYNGDARDIVDHEKTGILVDRESQEGLVLAMKNLIDNPLKRRKIGEAARRAVQKYRPAVVMKRWDALFRQLALGTTADLDDENGSNVVSGRQ